MKLLLKGTTQNSGEGVKYFKYCEAKEEDGGWTNPHYLPVTKDEEFDVAIDTTKKGKVFVIAASTDFIKLPNGSLMEKQVALGVNTHCDDAALLFQTFEFTFERGLLDIGLNGFFSVFQVIGFDAGGNMRLRPVEGYQHTALTFEEV